MEAKVNISVPGSLPEEQEPGPPCGLSFSSVGRFPGSVANAAGRSHETHDGKLNAYQVL